MKHHFELPLNISIESMREGIVLFMLEKRRGVGCFTLFFSHKIMEEQTPTYTTNRADAYLEDKPNSSPQR